MSSLTIDTGVKPELEIKPTPSNKVFTIGLLSTTTGCVCAVACAILLLAGGPYSLMIGLAIGAAALLIAGTACNLLGSSSRVITDETPKPFERIHTPTPPTPLSSFASNKLPPSPSSTATTESLEPYDEQAAMTPATATDPCPPLLGLTPNDDLDQMELGSSRSAVSETGVPAHYFESTTDDQLLPAFGTSTRFSLDLSEDEDRKHVDSESPRISASASEQESVSPFSLAQVAPLHSTINQDGRATARLRQHLTILCPKLVESTESFKPSSPARSVHNEESSPTLSFSTSPSRVDSPFVEDAATSDLEEDMMDELGAPSLTPSPTPSQPEQAEEKPTEIEIQAHANAMKELLAKFTSDQRAQMPIDESDEMSFEELDKKIRQSQLNAHLAALDAETRKLLTSIRSPAVKIPETKIRQETVAPALVKAPSKPFVERVKNFMNTSPYANYVLSGALITSYEALNYWGMPTLPSLDMFCGETRYTPPCPGPCCPPT